MSGAAFLCREFAGGPAGGAVWASGGGWSGPQRPPEFGAVQIVRHWRVHRARSQSRGGRATDVEGADPAAAGGRGAARRPHRCDALRRGTVCAGLGAGQNHAACRSKMSAGAILRRSNPRRGRWPGGIQRLRRSVAAACAHLFRSAQTSRRRRVRKPVTAPSGGRLASGGERRKSQIYRYRRSTAANDKWSSAVIPVTSTIVRNGRHWKAMVQNTVTATSQGNRFRCSLITSIASLLHYQTARLIRQNATSERFSHRRLA